MGTHANADVNARLDRLERELRRWRLAAVVAGGVLGLVALPARAAEPPQTGRLPAGTLVCTRDGAEMQTRLFSPTLDPRETAHLQGEVRRLCFRLDTATPYVVLQTREARYADGRVVQVRLGDGARSFDPWVPEATLTAPASGEQRHPVPSPVNLGTWTTSGSIQTPSFTVEAPEWEVRWAGHVSAGTEKLGLLVIGVYDAATRLAVTTITADPAKDPTGASRVHAKPGRYYLDIAVAGARMTVTAVVPEGAR